jgi:hypothetical protein
VPHTVLIRKYPMHPRLGRHQVLDSRSLDHAIDYGIDATATKLCTVDHEPPCPVLDQENLHAQGISVRAIFPDTQGLDDADALGSCVGNATVAHLTERVGMPRIKLTPDSPAAGEVLAIERYHRATEYDSDLADEYPNIDCGSSGLGSARACKTDGLISSYRHATTARGLLTLAQDGTVLIGMPWYQAMFDPDPHGFVDTGRWVYSGVAGGHEVCLTAVEKLVLVGTEPDPANTVLRFRNSWGAGWGDHGSFRMRLSTYILLRRQIDVIQFAA